HALRAAAGSERHDRTGSAPPAPRGPLLRGRAALLLVPEALGADDADGGLRLALRADGAHAALTQHEALPVGMPVAVVVGVCCVRIRRHCGAIRSWQSFALCP